MKDGIKLPSAFISMEEIQMRDMRKNQLPYDFDLLYDCKTVGEVRRRLKWLQDTVQRCQREYQGLHKMAREHGLNTNNLPENLW